MTTALQSAFASTSFRRFSEDPQGRPPLSGRRSYDSEGQRSSTESRPGDPLTGPSLEKLNRCGPAGWGHASAGPASDALQSQDGASEVSRHTWGLWSLAQSALQDCGVPVTGCGQGGRPPCVSQEWWRVQDFRQHVAGLGHRHVCTLWRSRAFTKRMAHLCNLLCSCSLCAL